MKKQWSIVIGIILVLVVAVLSVLNVDPVPINFGFTVVEWPMILVIVGALLSGAIIASLFSTVKIYQERKLRKQAQKELATADEKKLQKSERAEENKTFNEPSKKK